MESKELEIIVESEKVTENDENAIIDKSVIFINKTIQKTLYQGSIEIGNHVINNIFNGDFEAAVSKSPNKQVSFRKLCEHPDLAVKPSELSKMVRVAAQEEFFKENKIENEGLSYTHKVFLTKLSNKKIKIDIIDQCLKEKWSTRKLEKEIAKKKKYLSSQTTYHPTVVVKQLATKIKSFTGAKSFEKIPDVDELKKLKINARKTIRKTVSEMIVELEEGKTKIDEILTDCNQLINGLDSFENELQETVRRRKRKK